MTFRTRLLVALVLVTAASLGGGFAAVSIAFKTVQERQFDAALREVMALERQHVAQLGPQETAISDEPGPTANDVGPIEKLGAIYDASGVAVVSTFGGAAPPGAQVRGRVATGGDEAFDVEVSGRRLRALASSVPGRPELVLLIASPRADLDSDAAMLDQAMALVIGVVLLWAGGMAFWLIRRLTHGHDLIASVLRRVANGDLSARVRSGRDAPEVEQLATDVDTMVERLEELVGSQRRFVARAAHELRSPVTALYGELSHALRRDRSAEAYRDAIVSAVDAARELKQLTEDLLSLARVGTDGRSERERDVVSLRRCAESVVRALATEEGREPPRIAIVGDEGVVLGIEPDLRRLLRNVVENAIDHSERVGRGQVQVSIETGEVLVRVRIEDDGAGVPEGERERIFEPFHRGSRAARREGAGLGLAIAREIARAHHGDVRLVAPAPGFRTAFELTLPAQPGGTGVGEGHPSTSTSVAVPRLADETGEAAHVRVPEAVGT